MRECSYSNDYEFNYALINTISVSKTKALVAIASATLYFIHFYISFLVK